MFSPDPRPDLFDIYLPTTFFDKTICKEFNDYLKVMNGMLDNIEDVINESIQSINIPGWGYDRLDQQTVSYTNDGRIVPNTIYFRPNIAPNNLVDVKEFEIVFRHLDSYLNYFCLLFHFHKYFSFDEPKNYCIDVLPVSIKNSVGQKIGTVMFKKVSFIGMSAVSLGYDKINREFSVFSCRFGFVNMDFAFDPPTANITNHLIVVDTVINSGNLEPANLDLTIPNSEDYIQYFQFKDEQGNVIPASMIQNAVIQVNDSNGGIATLYELGLGLLYSGDNIVMNKTSINNLNIGTYNWMFKLKLAGKSERTIIIGDYIVTA